ncbi:Ferritin [Trachipleistophora hominis]|uniref:Ferritin n=1 Tax=Trachipleistophora hominis TaxID=72359 RepID=L7JY44_TRAHO|nr:Ferritin [Trachipleistophora hominis]
MLFYDHFCAFKRTKYSNFAMEEKKKWSDEVEELLSEQLRIENFAFYFYQSAYQYCNSREMALPSIANFFYKQYNEELTHAKGIIDYMNQTGLRPKFKELSLERTNYKSLVEVFELSLKYEEESYKHILQTYKAADKHHDYALCQFMDDYVAEQVKSIKEFSDYLQNAKRCAEGFATFNLDAEFKSLTKKY